MQHDVLVEKVVQNLSFEVVAVPNDSAVEAIGQPGRTTLKVKVKVRKKGKPDVYHGNMSIREKDPTGTVTDKIRFVSSDQTISSFDMFLEAEQKSPIKKNRNKFFDLLRPGMCLGNQSDEKDFYVPRKSQNTITSITSKSDGVLKQHLALSKKDYLDRSTALSRKNQNFLGKCKPGGCLDPPFSEEKYSYIPIQKHSQIETSTFTGRNLYIGDDVCASKNDSASKTTLSKQILSGPDNSGEVDSSPQEQPAKSVQKLYEAEFVNTSLSITYSNSIITYPPTLTDSEIRLNNEKSGQQRQSIDSKTKKSYEMPQSYFIPPRVTTNQVDGKDLDQSKFLLKDENRLSQELLIKRPSNSKSIEHHESSIETAAPEISIEPKTTNIKIKSLVDDPKLKEALEGHAFKPNGGLILNLPEDIKQLSLDPTSLFVKKHELKSDDESPILGSLVVQSRDTVSKSSVKPSLTGTNLPLPKVLSDILAQKENINFDKTPDILPLSLEENNENIETTHTTPTQINIPKSSSTNVRKSTESIGSKEPQSPLHQSQVTPFKNGNDATNEQKTTMDHENKLDAYEAYPAKQLLRTGLDTGLLEVLEKANESPALSNEGFINSVQNKQKEISIHFMESIPIENNDGRDINTTPTPNKAENQLLSDKEKQQKDYINSTVPYTAAKNMEQVTKTDSQRGLNLNQQDVVVFPINDIREDNVSYPHLDQGQPENKLNLLVLDKSYEHLLKEKSFDYLGDTYDSTIKNSESHELAEKQVIGTASPKEDTPFANLNDNSMDQEITHLNEIFKDEKERNADPQTNRELDSHLDQNKQPSHIDAESSYKSLTDLRYSEDGEKSTVNVGEDIFYAEGTVPAVTQNEKKNKTEIIQHDAELVEAKDEKILEPQDIPLPNLLENNDIQFMEAMKSKIDIKLNSSILISKYENATKITSDKSIPSQQVDTIEEADINLETKKCPEISPDMDTKMEMGKSKDEMLLTGIVDDNTSQLSRHSQLHGLKPTEKAPYLSQKRLSAESKYGVEGISIPNTQSLMIARPESQENEYQNISLRSINQHEDTSFINESDIKRYKSSTIFDVLAIPDPKKLKDEIAVLKSTSVRYTPSETSILPSAKKKDSVTVDLAFHSYVNERNEKILKTFRSDNEPQRYLDDSIIIIKSDINLSNNEIKIPIDLERNLIVQLRRADEMDDRKQLDVLDALTQPQYSNADTRNVKTNKHFKISSTDKSKITNTMSLYEKELLPLQKAIKDLKEEVEYLARNNLLLKDNLPVRKMKQTRLCNVNKRCACLKRIF